MYYIARVNFKTENDETGKVKNIREEYLVYGNSVTDVENKLKEKFENGISEFSVIEVKQSKILSVIE